MPKRCLWILIEPFNSRVFEEVKNINHPVPFTKLVHAEPLHRKFGGVWKRNYSRKPWNTKSQCPLPTTPRTWKRKRNRKEYQLGVALLCMVWVAVKEKFGLRYFIPDKKNTALKRNDRSCTQDTTSLPGV